MQKWGEAEDYYKSALLIEPTNEDITENLSILREATYGQHSPKVCCATNSPRKGRRLRDWQSTLRAMMARTVGRGAEGERGIDSPLCSFHVEVTLEFVNRWTAVCCEVGSVR